MSVFIMSLDNLAAQLGEHKQKYPPVELWDPPYCGEIDIEIKANGIWLYNGSEIKRKPLVKLFASVLKKEQDDYFLVTPVEKVKIKVEDAPLILTQWQWSDEQQKTIEVSTNLDDVFLLDESHPIDIQPDGSLQIIVRRNLTAKVHRNVYYQWIDLGIEKATEQGTALVINSAGTEFNLGFVD